MSLDTYKLHYYNLGIHDSKDIYSVRKIFGFFSVKTETLLQEMPLNAFNFCRKARLFFRFWR